MVRFLEPKTWFVRSRVIHYLTHQKFAGIKGSFIILYKNILLKKIKIYLGIFILFYILKII
jgi:hypothetical protein